MVVGHRLHPVRYPGIIVGHHDADVRAVADGVLAVDVALPRGVVGEVLHPMVAELEVPVLRSGFVELDDECHAGLDTPVTELEMTVVG